MRISPSKICGQLTLPPSKSQTMRAVLFASLAKGTSSIINPLSSPDTHAMLLACENIGAKVVKKTWGYSITGVDRKLQVQKETIDAGNSGIVLRFLTALHTLQEKKVTIKKDLSLQKRPMGALKNALPTTEPLTPGQYFIDGKDSQPVSALLISLSCLEGESQLFVTNPGEIPWVKMTLDWLGDRVVCEKFTHYKIKGKPFQAFEYSVPGDLSSAAFPAAAALLTQGELAIFNAPLNNLQGDLQFFYHLKKMGAAISFEKDVIYLNETKMLFGNTFDINDCIDSICILSVVGAFAEGVTEIINAEVAREKECDRISVMANELNKMGAVCMEKQDGLLLFQSPLKGATLNSHLDHRVAMALTVAALASNGPSELLNAECVAKTYSNFFQEMKRLGANIR